MDHCFPKKGLTLSSRQHALFSHNNPTIIPKLPQRAQIQFNRTLPQNVSLIPQTPYGKPQLQQFQPIAHPTHHRTLSVNPPNSLPQTQALNPDSNLNIQVFHNRQMAQQLNPANENSQFKFFSFQQMQQNLREQETEAKDQQRNRVALSIQQARPLAQLKILPENFDLGRSEMKSPTNKVSFDKSRMHSPRQQSIIKPVKVSIHQPNNQKDVNIQNNPIQISHNNQDLVAEQKILQHRILKLQKQNQQLSQQLKTQITKNQNIEESNRQKQNLIKILEQRDAKIKEIEQNSIKKQRDYSTKINTIQQQIRLLKGNKNRLQIEVKNNQKLVKSQREKNQKTRQQIDKLMFFQQDLIHAKDYNKLKQEIDYISAENCKLFEEHHKFIQQTSQYRKKAEESINELEKQLRAIRLQNQKFQDNINALTQCGEDKLLNIKLQNQLNFLVKKIQEQKHTISEQQKQLKQSFQLRAQQNESKRSQGYLDQISIRQIQDTICLYEARLSDMSEQIAKRQAENNSQKRTLDLLTTQLRRSRQQKHINAVKEKSNQNNVKNLKGEVQAVQRSYQIELQLKNKKVSNLQQSIQRKIREIVQKDKFIKQFLLNRLKGLDNTSLESINHQIKQYFQSANSDNPPQPNQT